MDWKLVRTTKIWSNLPEMISFSGKHVDFGINSPSLSQRNSPSGSTLLLLGWLRLGLAKLKAVGIVILSEESRILILETAWASGPSVSIYTYAKPLALLHTWQAFRLAGVEGLSWRQVWPDVLSSSLNCKDTVQ